MNPHMLKELKANIKTETAQITGALLNKVSTNIIKSI
jgi:hypothetical protein